MKFGTWRVRFFNLDFDIALQGGLRGEHLCGHSVIHRRR